MPGNRETKQPEVMAICNFERLGGIDQSDIAGTAHLDVAPLKIAANPFELQIYEAQIV
jgi:hypothetical protein